MRVEGLATRQTTCHGHGSKPDCRCISHFSCAGVALPECQLDACGEASLEITASSASFRNIRRRVVSVKRRLTDLSFSSPRRLDRDILSIPVEYFRDINKLSDQCRSPSWPCCAPCTSMAVWPSAVAEQRSRAQGFATLGGAPGSRATRHWEAMEMESWKLKASCACDRAILETR